MFYTFVYLSFYIFLMMMFRCNDADVVKKALRKKCALSTGAKVVGASQTRKCSCCSAGFRMFKHRVIKLEK